MPNILGPLIGASLDRKDGDSGVKGALLGSLVQSAIRTAVPLLITFALGKFLHRLTKEDKPAGDGGPAAR